MVRLKVVARVISEDAYLAHLENPTNPISFPGEKKFFIIVKEPETWQVGTLAIAIRNKYLSLYRTLIIRGELGQIKYLKDDTDDCDLDPEDTLSDAFINEGKALADKYDQHATVKVIREQGRTIRDGSVIPDLTPAHYHIPVRPPVPQFNVPRFEDLESPLGKRKLDAASDQGSEASKKRVRMSSIEQNQAVPSIENGHTRESRSTTPQRRRSNRRNMPRSKGPDTGLAGDDQPTRAASPGFSPIRPPSVSTYLSRSKPTSSASSVASVALPLPESKPASSVSSSASVALPLSKSKPASSTSSAASAAQPPPKSKPASSASSSASVAQPLSKSKPASSVSSSASVAQLPPKSKPASSASSTASSTASVAQPLPKMASLPPPSHSEATSSPTVPTSTTIKNNLSQTPPTTQRPTCYLTQARNMQLSLKDLHKRITADSASNSSINSPALNTDRTSFIKDRRSWFGKDGGDSDDSDDSDESGDVTSEDEATSKENVNGKGRNGISSRGGILHVPDPTIRDVTDEDDDFVSE